MILLLAHLLVTSSSAHLCNFAPKNDMSIPDVAHWGGGISRKEFKEVIGKVVDYYKPIIQQKGAQLIVNDNWQSSTVNASAEQEGNKWYLNMYGGLARHKLMTKDAFALVVCHELGHHVGGFPYYDDGDWASNEGQSDYFATMKCFRRVYEYDDHSGVLGKLTVPEIVHEKCALGFQSENDLHMCARESMAGLQISRFLDDLRHFTEGKNTPSFEITFEEPDTSVVNHTENGHPAAQCRLDTYFAGSICPVHYSTDFSRDEAITGACSMENRDSYGYRPRCWYAPSQR